MSMIRAEYVINRNYTMKKRFVTSIRMRFLKIRQQTAPQNNSITKRIIQCLFQKYLSEIQARNVKKIIQVKKYS